MFSTLRSRGRMKPYGQLGWLEILLIVVGVVIAILFHQHPSP